MTQSLCYMYPLLDVKGPWAWGSSILLLIVTNPRAWQDRKVDFTSSREPTVTRFVFLQARCRESIRR